MKVLSRFLIVSGFLIGSVCALGVESANLAEFNLADSVATYRARQNEATPQSVFKWLVDGNQRFADGRSIHGGYSVDARQRIQVAATGQRPLATVLSCIDSRTTADLVFDTTVGDLFTVRVGANVINEDIVGSIEIAAESGTKVVVVMGHTDCGGVKAACAGVDFGHFTQLLERVKPAIASTNARLDSDPSLSAEVGERIVTNRRYIAEVSHANAKQSAAQLLAQSAILRQKVAAGEIIFVSAIYSVETGLVHFDEPAK